jgi:hypothetical protein
VLSAQVDNKKIAQQDVLVINGVEGASTMYAPFIRNYYGLPNPRSWRVLSGAAHAHDIFRVAPNILDLHVLGGTMLDSDFEKNCRADASDVYVNETVSLTGLKVIIRSVRDGKPVRVRYIFPKSLDDPSYVFLETRADQLVRITLPPVGQHVRIRRGQMAFTIPVRGPRPNAPIKAKTP